MNTCNICKGTGVNHYSDNDTCSVCDGYGVLKHDGCGAKHECLLGETYKINGVAMPDANAFVDPLRHSKAFFSSATIKKVL